MKIIKDKISGQIHLEIDVLSVNRKLIYCSGKYLPTLGKNETVSYNKYNKEFWDELQKSIQLY